MLSSLKSYWERLRAGRIAPYRAEIDPRQFEAALENMFILEKVSADNMRIRLAGMKVCEMMGMEVRGMQPGYLIDEDDRLRFDRLLNVVMNEPAVVELRLEARNRAGTYHATMLLMPLRSDFGDINRVLGCASGEGGAASSTGGLFRPGVPFKVLAEEAERAILEQALAHHGGQMAATARGLGLERSHLYKKSRSLGLRGDKGEAEDE